MTVKEKWQRICELGPAEILMRPQDGSFYVEQRGVEVSEGIMLVSPNQAGKTANAAVEECFEQYTLNSPKVVIDAYTGHRVEWRWNSLDECWQGANSPILATHLIT
jgi:hypothetical protein